VFHIWLNGPLTVFAEFKCFDEIPPFANNSLGK